MPCDKSRRKPLRPQLPMWVNPTGGGGRVGPVQSAGGGAHLAAPAQRHHQRLGTTGAGSAADVAGRVAVNFAGVAASAHPHCPRVSQGSVHSQKNLIPLAPISSPHCRRTHKLPSERSIEMGLCTSICSQSSPLELNTSSLRPMSPSREIPE